MNTIKMSEKMTTRHPFRKKQNTLLFCFDFITKAQICQYVCAERRYSLLHYYLLLQKIMNASLVKSKELKSKNPERFRIRDFCVHTTNSNLIFFSCFSYLYTSLYKHPTTFRCSHQSAQTLLKGFLP